MQEKEQKFSPIKQRILQFVDTLGISKRDFYRSVGISRGTLESGSGITEEVLAKFIAAYDHVSPEWLLTGQGAMLRPAESARELHVEGQFALKSDKCVPSQRIPLYNLEATAGLVSLFDDSETLPMSYISLPNLPSCDGAVYVRGDSMYPLLKSGDIVLYKQIHDLEFGIFWGEMYLVSFNIDGDEYVTIKYIQKSEREGFVKLVSHNPHHDPKEIPLSMIRALALIKASVRYNAIR